MTDESVPTPDLKAWIVETRSKAVARSRALYSVLVAARHFRAIVDEWKTLSEEQHSARFTAGIVQYSRPFVPNRRTGRGKYTQPVRELRSAPGFDADLHEHILDLRDKIVAHDDDQYSERMFHAGVATIRVRDLLLEVPIEVGISTNALVGFEQIELAQAYASHADAVAAAMGVLIDRELDEILKLGLKEPELLKGDTSVPAGDISEENGQFRVKTMAPASLLSEPAIPVDGYRYKPSGRGRRLEGKVSVPIPGDTVIIELQRKRSDS